MGGVRVNGLLCVGRCVDESDLERCVCVCGREMSREVNRLHAATVNHARHRPDRSPPKCGLPAMVGDGVIADFAASIRQLRVSVISNQSEHVTLTLLHPLPSLQP